MSKHKVLTSADLNGYKVNNNLIQIINNYLKLNDIQKDEIKILDWGSGRGRTVAALREQGYNTYGVEIDPIPYYNGLPYFNSRYQNPTEFLKLIDKTCLTPFQENEFDIVYSEQVLEHVAEIQLLADEFSRITKTGGEHKHRFPHNWHLVEDHLLMPAIHWLPKNWIRYYLIYLYLIIGIDPKWKELHNNNIKDKLKTYYEYSINKTYYRSIGNLKQVFHQRTFSFDYRIIKYKLNPLRIHSFFPSAVDVFLKKQ